MKTVSIVIPSRNEEKYIGNCLDSIIRSTYPKEYLSVLVCDGNSKDKTQDIIMDYENKYPFITCLRNERLTTPYALNLGIKHNHSDIVIILGAHSYIAPDFIDQCVLHLDKNEEIGCVGGILENIYENEDSKIIGFAMSQPFGVGTAYFRTGAREGFVDTVPFGAYRREVFDKIGYFDTNLVRNQDDEFNFRLTEAGYKIYLSKDIKSYYAVRASFTNLFNQYYQYGYWKIYVNKKHRKITTFRQTVPFLFVIFLFAGLVWSLFSPVVAIVYFSVLLIYLITGFAFSFKQKMSLRSRFKVVYSFIILHISYGFGYANGIGDFLINHGQPNRKMSTLTR